MLFSFSLHANRDGRIGFVVVKNATPKIQMGYYNASTMGPIADWIPPQGRVTRTFAHKQTGTYANTYEILVDNGKGHSTTGYISENDVAFFRDQGQAEAYATRMRTNSSTTTGTPVLVRPNIDHSSREASQANRASNEGTLQSGSSLKKIETLSDAQNYLAQIQNKLKTALGNSFVSKAKPSWQPTAQDRIKYIETIDKTLTPQEKAFFSMVSTAFAEDRMSAADRNNPEDPQGRASMLFTMKVIENRTESRFARQFMDNEYLSADKLEKIWGVITADRQFSSWNAGSANFGNTIRAMLGVGDNEAAARNRALASYRDFSSGKVNFEGFNSDNDGATMMLNRNEVSGIRNYMRKDADYRRRNASSIVSWTVESIMHDPRRKPGTYQVALRVPAFSISLPASENGREYVKVDSKDIGHWPVYLKNVATRDMEAARRSQGGW